MSLPQLYEVQPDGRQIPILFAVASDSGRSLRVFCCYCGRWHVHGRNPDEPMGASNGHRVSHCLAEDSPYIETGYILVEVASLPKPERVYKLKYTRDGAMVSGYLAAQKRALKKSR